MSSIIEIQWIAIVVSIACSIPGCFLVLRRMSMLTDAISHTILLGIVLSFFVVKDLDSFILVIGATLMGLCTVWFIEFITKTQLVYEDAAIGIVYPLFFSIAIVLISYFASNVHIDTDAVLLGELAFASFNRCILFGVDIGPKAFYSGLFILVLNGTFVYLMFKQLKVSTFDPILAYTLGIVPSVVHYSLMTIVSITAVCSFDIVGSILVIAFMVAPANTAYLICKDIKKMIMYSCLFSSIGAIVGFQLAYYLDVSIAGMIAVILGVQFFLVYLVNTNNGLIITLYRKRQLKIKYMSIIMMKYIIHHRNYMNVDDVLYIMDDKRVECYICYCTERNWLYCRDGFLYMLDEGIDVVSSYFDV